MLDFEGPLLLLLAPAAVILLWLAGRDSLARWTRRQAIWCGIVRVVIVLLLVIAVASPRRLIFTRDAGVVLVRDVSASIGAEAGTQAEQFITQARKNGSLRSAEVDFAAFPTVRRAWGAKEEVSDYEKPDDRATDTGAAMEFAAALLPSHLGHRIVLLTDGRTTAGREPAGIAAALAAWGVEMDVVALREPKREEVAIASIDLPQNLREGEFFDLSVHLHSTVKAPATVKLYQNNLLAAAQQVEVGAGTTTVVFPRVRAEGKFAVYDVAIEPGRDTLAENNRSRRAVAHGGAPKLLIIDREMALSEPLASALRSSDFQTEIRSPEGFPSQLEELEGFDLVIFCNAPASDFRGDQLELLRKWVRDFGGGFVMTGGENSFGADGYYRTPVEEVLPVRATFEREEETPSLGLVLVIDRSGSMTGEKLEMAKSAAQAAVDLLSPRDYAGVVAFANEAFWAADLQSAVAKRSIENSIASITPGGGTNIAPGMATALQGLRSSPAKIKHVILLTDGISQPGPFQELTRQMEWERITVSTVAVGSDADTRLLAQIAKWGNGRYYYTDSSDNIPRIFTLETMRATESSLWEDAVLAVPRSAHAVTGGIYWEQAPPLLGLNVTQLKAGAEMPLSTDAGDLPLFALWRYGLGQVAAFTSDACARWAAEWLAWPGYAKFWTQLARQITRLNQRHDLSVDVKEREGRIHVDVDAIAPDGSFRNGLPVAVTMAAGDASPVSIPAQQTGPGRYEAVLDVPPTDFALVAVSDGRGQPISVAWARDYPAEFSTFTEPPTDLQELATLSNGRLNPAPEEVFRPVSHPVVMRQDLSVFLLAAALLLFPVDIWLRRRDWENSSLQKSPAL